MTSLQAVVLAVQNDPTDPPLMVGEWLESAGIEVRVIRAIDGEDVPSTVPAGVHGIMPLGGAMGANDDDVAPWLPDERRLLADAVRTETPVLGLCLGAQLLAAATGGRVELSPITEIGLSTVHRTDDGRADPVMSALPHDAVPAAQWHQDHIAALPEGAVLLLTNDACRVQAFRLGAGAYGLQMHPEVDARTFRSWRGAEDDDEALVRSGRDADDAAAEVASAEAALIETWRPAALAWAELVLRRARA